MTYIPGGGSSGGQVSTSSDVALNNVTNGQVLTYDTSIAKWKNANASASLSTRVPFVMLCTNGAWPTARITEENPHVWRKTSATDADPDPTLLRNFIDTIEEFQT